MVAPTEQPQEITGLDQRCRHWALNVGTEYSKQFLPDEIAWFREVVERCNDAAAAQEEPNP